jgi:hypothetical protein
VTKVQIKDLFMGVLKLPIDRSVLELKLLSGIRANVVWVNRFTLFFCRLFLKDSKRYLIHLLFIYHSFRIRSSME